jgi:putative transcriptional regulator
MDRHFDDDEPRPMAEQPRRRRRGDPRWQDEEPEGWFAVLRRPLSRDDDNPLVDRRAPRTWTITGAEARRPPASRQAGARPDPEFTRVDIVEIRRTLHATQRQFARMFGISVETLRNWEQGKRRPQGPARALLRVAQANPNAVARVLKRYRCAWWLD